MASRTVFDLDTPALLVDLARVRANCDRVEMRCRDLGVRFRPHLKTAKSIDVARLLPSAFDHGITVSTVKEAEYFAGEGVSDILYAVTVPPDKLPRLAALTRGGARVRLAVDAADAADAMTAYVSESGAEFDVVIEIDSGEHRSGIAPDDARVVDMARGLHAADGIRFGGVYTHAGHVYECRTTEEARHVAAAERAAAVGAATRIRDAGIPCEMVSVGSTPTLIRAEHLDGVTEARAGVCVFQDLFQAGIGSCEIDDIALSVLTTVIGHQPSTGTLLVDAGGLALSKDRSTAALGPDADCGYGLVAPASATDPIPGWRVADAYQEHGLVRSTSDPIDFDSYPIGTRLRVLPNHACMTAAQYDGYHVVESGRVVDEWARINGW